MILVWRNVESAQIRGRPENRCSGASAGRREPPRADAAARLATPIHPRRLRTCQSLERRISESSPRNCASSMIKTVFIRSVSDGVRELTGKRLKHKRQKYMTKSGEGCCTEAPRNGTLAPCHRELTFQRSAPAVILEP